MPSPGRRSATGIRSRGTRSESSAEEWSRVAAGGATLALGGVRVTARVTGEAQAVDVAVLHTAAGGVHCRVRTATDPETLASARAALFRVFLGEGPPGVPGALARHFAGREYGVEAVFVDERRRLLGRVVEGIVAGGPANLPSR